MGRNSIPSSANLTPSTSGTSDNTNTDDPGSSDGAMLDAVRGAAQSFMGGYLQKMMAKQKEECEKLKSTDEDEDKDK